VASGSPRCNGMMPLVAGKSRQTNEEIDQESRGQMKVGPIQVASTIPETQAVLKRLEVLSSSPKFVPPLSDKSVE